MKARFARSVVSAALAVSALVAGKARVAEAQTASARNVTLKMNIPEGVTKAKAVLIFTARGLAGGWANGAAMATLAKKIEAPIIVVSGGDDLNDNSYPGRCASGEFNGIGEALTKLAEMSNHPEIANVPLVAVGHSHGGDYWNWYTSCHPEKMALVFVHASGGVNYSAGALEVPVIYELGTGDLIENGSKKPRAGMFVNRGKGAPMALVIGPGEGHDQVSAASLQMIIDIMEGVFRLRVPADADFTKGPLRLTKINEAAGWLGNLYTKDIAPYADFKGDKAMSAFLPTAEIAMKWKMTGGMLPMSIVLPKDTCSWCGTPKDEPKAAPGGEPNNAPAPADGGAGGSSGTGGASAGTGGGSGSSETGGTSGSSSTGGSSGSSTTGGSSGSSATGGSSGSSTTGGSSGSSATGGSSSKPEPASESDTGMSGGCTVGGGSAAPVAGVLGLLLAALALRRRRR
jgi:MYXO-CTERM domain-containing protein